jgi:hypothetical protein
MKFIILYALSFWVTECTPNPGRSFPHSPLSIDRWRSSYLQGYNIISIQVSIKVVHVCLLLVPGCQLLISNILVALITGIDRHICSKSLLWNRLRASIQHLYQEGSWLPTTDPAWLLVDGVHHSTCWGTKPTAIGCCVHWLLQASANKHLDTASASVEALQIYTRNES